MATSTIDSGGGGDYTTWQAWEDALPATLTEAEVGECINEEYSSGSNLLTVAGHTTSASNTITITAASGASFVDNANIETNALRYNASNGAGLRTTGVYPYQAPVIIDDPNCIITRLQFDGSTGSAFKSELFSGPLDIHQCIFEIKRSGDGFESRGSNATLRNSLFIVRTGGNSVGMTCFYSAALYNCTIVTPSDLTKGTTAIGVSYGEVTAVNCAFFGFTNVGGGTYTTCYCDDATPPTGCTQVTYGDQFENTTNASRDFRLKSGADCIDNGTTNSNGSPSINGVSRTTYDVGAWEFVAAGGGPAAGLRTLSLTGVGI